MSTQAETQTDSRCRRDILPARSRRRKQRLHHRLARGVVEQPITARFQNFNRRDGSVSLDSDARFHNALFTPAPRDPRIFRRNGPHGTRRSLYMRLRARGLRSRHYDLNRRRVEPLRADGRIFHRDWRRAHGHRLHRRNRQARNIRSAHCALALFFSRAKRFILVHADRKLNMRNFKFRRGRTAHPKARSAHKIQHRRMH